MPYRNLGRVSKAVKIRRLVWLVAYTLLFFPFRTRFFRVWRIAVLRLFGADVCWSAHVYASVKIWAPWNLRMAEGSSIGPRVEVYNQDEVSLGRNVVVSQDSCLCTASHDISHVNNATSGLLVAPIVVADLAWVASRAFIAPGVTIGEGAVVGATASVFKDVEPWTVVGGNPAKFIKKRELKD